jgi:CheY-like chemotaxis protein
VYLADDDTRSRDELFLSLAGIGISVAWSGPAHGLPEAMRTAIEAGLSTDVAIVGHVEQEGVDLAIAHTCRTDPRLVPTPLVLTPISGVRGYAREAREAGYSAYLPRPFHGNELSLCIRAVAAHSPPRSDDTRFVTRHSAAESPQLIRRVLLADDDPAGRRVTRLQIERLGFTVDEVPGGAEAITAASGGAYDLILMDCQMPDVNGLAAATAIRTQEVPGRRAFIVALSADVRAELREACWRAGVDEFLEKPLRTETLVRVLNAMTGLPELTLGGGHDGRSSDDVDLGALNALMADIGAEMTLDLLREYLANAERAVEQLTGSGQPDAGYVGREAHRLVGGARALGLRRLDHLWEELSTSATGGGDHRTIVEELRRACWNLGRWMDARQGKLYA